MTDFENAKRYYESGEKNFGLRKYDAAIADFKKAIEIYPDYAEPHLDIGNFYYYSRKYDEAVKYFTRAIEIKPHM